MAEEKSKNTTKVVIIVVAVLAVLGVAGYLLSNYVFNKVAEKTTEGIIEQATGGNVDIDNENISFQDEEGSYQVSGSSNWPESMPNQVPQFQYGDIAGSSSATSNGNDGWTVSFENVQSNAFENYKQDLLDNGWSEKASSTYGGSTTTMENGNLVMIFSYDPEGQTASLIINRD